MKRHLHILSVACCLLALLSCGNDGQQKSKGPIVLGDSSMIVTETDSSKLQDMVEDLHPVIPTHTQADTPKAQPQPAQDTTKADTAKAQPQEPQQAVAPTGKGLTIAFKQVTLFIPNITVHSYNDNLQKANGATYKLTGGNINGNELRVLTGNVSDVAMHYQTMACIKLDNGGLLPLDDLIHTTNWKVMKGHNNVYPISGLVAGQLEAAEPSIAQLRRAIQHAARRHHLSRATERELERDVRNLSRHRLPVLLRAVMWKVDGKDADGRPYSKQIRMDL